MGLERRTARGGKDSIDHGRGSHDDVANAVAGCCHLAATLPIGWLRDRFRTASDAPKRDYRGMFPESADMPAERGTGWMSGMTPR